MELWSLNGELKKAYKVDTAFLEDAFFSPSGKYFLVPGEKFSLWKTEGDVLVIFPQANYLTSAFLTDDVIITGSYEKGDNEDVYGVMHFYNRKGKMLIDPVQISEPFWGLNADQAGEHIVCHGEKKLFLFNSKGILLKEIKDIPGSLKSCVLAGNRKEILAFYDFGFGKASWCEAYDFSGNLLRRFRLHKNNSPLHIAMSKDGNYIACRFFDRIKVFSVFGTLLAGHLDPGESMDSGIRFSPGGKYLGCSTYNTGEVLQLKLWELK